MLDLGRFHEVRISRSHRKGKGKGNVMNVQGKDSKETSSNGLSSRMPCITFSLFKILLIYLFLAALGLCCCARAFSSCRERRLLFVVVRGLLIAVASVVEEHGL